MTTPKSLIAGAVGILRRADPAGKIARSHDVAAAWRSGALPIGARTAPPDRPARPDNPPLLPPRDMPRRRNVAIGLRWFGQVCRQSGHTPMTEWQALVRRHYRGPLKRPFNDAGRRAAGFDAAFYEPLAEPA
jgi:uncharacterized ferritin-like protein (DUF455 family)